MIWMVGLQVRMSTGRFPCLKGMYCKSHLQRLLLKLDMYKQLKSLNSSKAMGCIPEPLQKKDPLFSAVPWHRQNPKWMVCEGSQICSRNYHFAYFPGMYTNTLQTSWIYCTSKYHRLLTTYMYFQKKKNAFVTSKKLLHQTKRYIVPRCIMHEYSFLYIKKNIFPNLTGLNP